MSKYSRRILIGVLAGLAASPLLALTQENALIAISLGVLVGIVRVLAFPVAPHAYADSAMTAATLGVPA